MSYKIEEKLEALDEKCDLIVKFVSENKNEIVYLAERTKVLEQQLTNLKSIIDAHTELFKEVSKNMGDLSDLAGRHHNQIGEIIDLIRNLHQEIRQQQSD